MLPATPGSGQSGSFFLLVSDTLSSPEMTQLFREFKSSASYESNNVFYLRGNIEIM